MLMWFILEPFKISGRYWNHKTCLVFKILKFVYIHWKYPALANLKYVRVKNSNLNSNIYVRTALFACVQYYLYVFNVIYVRSMLFTLICLINIPLLIIFGKFEDLPPPPRLSFSTILQNVYLKNLTFIRQYHIGVLLQNLCYFQNT